MSSSLTEFLKTFKISDKSVPWTHTWMGEKYKYSYHIPEEKYPELFRLYTEHINNGLPVHLTERLDKKAGPLLIDIDLKFTLEVEERVFSRNYHRIIVFEYLKIIKKYLDLSDLEQFLVLIFRKPDIKIDEEKGIVKDGLHIIFPEIVTDRRVQHKIRDDIIKVFEEKEYFADLPITNSLEDVFDANIIDKNPWLMYKSSKFNAPAYDLYSFFIINYDNTTKKYAYSSLRYDSDVYDTYPSLHPDNIVSYLSVHRSKTKLKYIDEKSEETVNAWYFNAINKSKDNYENGIIPKQKNVEKMDQSEKIKLLSKYVNLDNISDLSKKKFIVVDKTIDDFHIDIDVEDNYIINEAKVLVSLLSEKRAADYHKWANVGWCLCNISKDKMYDAFIDFSKRCPEKFTFESCDDLWEKYDFNYKGLTIGSLRNWAKEDNAVYYEQFVNKNILKKIDSSNMNGTEYDIAKIAYEILKDRFVCSQISKETVWYEFKKNRWHKSDAGTKLYGSLSTLIHNKFAEIGKHYQKLSLESTEEQNTICTNMAKYKASFFSEICKNLKKSNFKKNLMVELSHLFYIEKFEDKLDSNPNLICCENGVYDLKLGVFRNGCYDDYVSLSTGQDYIPYDPDDPIIKDIDLFFSQIQANVDDNLYLKLFLGSTLSGIQPERFYIWTGGGGNGKSILTSLIENAIGDYAGKVPVSILTQKRGKSSGANPELVCLKGTRFVTMQEPEDDAPMNVNLMKELVGNDILPIRGLYKDPIKLVPQWCLVLICNNMPIIPQSAANDHGTWRRIRVLNFGSEFVENPDKNLGNQFKIDHDLKNKIKSWGAHFLSYLIHYNQIFNDTYKGVLYNSPSVDQVTREYQENNDNIFNFLSNNIVTKKDTSVSISDLYLYFENWFSEEFGNKDKPKKKEFKEYIKRKYRNNYRHKKDLLMNYTMRTEIDEESEYDESDNENEIIVDSDDEE